MELKNCPQCGRVFAYNGVEVCSRCANYYEEDFKKVKEYLYDHPRATIIEVSEETNVTEKKILGFLREGRIEIADEENFILDCERCGKSIRSGRFCDQCVAEMHKEFTSVLKGPKEVERSGTNTARSKKMYTADIRKKFK